MYDEYLFFGVFLGIFHLIFIVIAFIVFFKNKKKLKEGSINSISSIGFFILYFFTVAMDLIMTPLVLYFSSLYDQKYFCIIAKILIIITAILFFGLIFFSSLLNKKTNKIMVKLIPFALVIIIGLLAIKPIDKFHTNSGNKNTSTERCSICGGEFKCAICGKDGPYCENASYGKGSDHFCQEHWADCIAWHEGRKN